MVFGQNFSHPPKRYTVSHSHQLKRMIACDYDSRQYQYNVLFSAYVILTKNQFFALLYVPCDRLRRNFLDMQCCHSCLCRLSLCGLTDYLYANSSFLSLMSHLEVSGKTLDLFSSLFYSRWVVGASRGGIAQTFLATRHRLNFQGNGILNNPVSGGDMYLSRNCLKSVSWEDWFVLIREQHTWLALKGVVGRISKHS